MVDYGGEAKTPFSFSNTAILELLPPTPLLEDGDGNLKLLKQSSICQTRSESVQNPLCVRSLGIQNHSEAQGFAHSAADSIRPCWFRLLSLPLLADVRRKSHFKVRLLEETHVQSMRVVVHFPVLRSGDTSLLRCSTRWLGLGL